MQNLRRLLGMIWQDQITTISILTQAGMPSLFAILSQRCLHWLGHVCQMEDRCIPKDFLYSQPASDSHLTSQPTIPFKDVCKKDLKTCRIQPAELEMEVSNCTTWWAKVKKGIKPAEEKRELEREKKRTSRHRTQPVPTSHTTPPLTTPAASANAIASPE